MNIFIYAVPPQGFGLPKISQSAHEGEASPLCEGIRKIVLAPMSGLSIRLKGWWAKKRSTAQAKPKALCYLGILNLQISKLGVEIYA
ncbi:hypothetical protein A1QE_12535 [Vibrio breoganii ZF-55]|nr:hypothetical protein A1QE_12535 [Vibrio breoganii ZF-55]